MEYCKKLACGDVIEARDTMYTLSKAHILHTGRNLENVYIPTTKHNAHVPDTSFCGILFVEVIGESYSNTHT
jgi:hypothetical protein